MIGDLIQRVTGLGHWGYVVICATATLEASAFLGLAIPGETVVLVSGFLASRGLLEVVRPQFDDPFLTLNTYGFPTGHTMAATVLSGTIAAFVAVSIPDWRSRALAVPTALLLVHMPFGIMSASAAGAAK